MKQTELIKIAKDFLKLFEKYNVSVNYTQSNLKW